MVNLMHILPQYKKKKVHFALDQGKFITKKSMPILIEDQLNQVLEYQYICFKSLPVILMSIQY